MATEPVCICMHEGGIQQQSLHAHACTRRAYSSRACMHMLAWGHRGESPHAEGSLCQRRQHTCACTGGLIAARVTELTHTWGSSGTKCN